MKMDKANLNKFRTSFNSAVAELAKEFDVKIDLGKITYSDDSFTAKVSVANTDAEPQEVKDFKQYANLVGLEPEDLGKTFKSNGKVFTITGLNLGRRKYPISATSEGRSYKFNDSDVARLLKLEALTK